jgi:hypothetical protein
MDVTLFHTLIASTATHLVAAYGLLAAALCFGVRLL